MSDHSFTGASKDPIALLEQLLGHVGALRADMAEVKADVAGLKTDVAGLKTDVAELKTDVAELKTDVAELKNDVDLLKAEVAHIKVELVETNSSLRGFKQETRTRFDQIDRHFTSLEGELRQNRALLTRFVSSVDEDQAAFRTQVDHAVERKVYLAVDQFRQTWEERQRNLEERIAALETAERRRTESAT